MQLSTRRLSPGPIAEISPGPGGVYHAEEGWRIRIVADTAELATARLSGVALTMVDCSQTNGTFRQAWDIEMFVWAGRSTVLIVAGAESQLISIEVAPHGAKLGAPAFRAMLEELAATSKDALWGLSPGSIVAARDTNSPGIVHPAVIEAELQDVLNAISQLRHDLLLQRERRRDVLPLARSRRPDGRTLQWMLRNGRSQIALRAIEDGLGLPDPTLLVDQATMIVTTDHPANRYLAYLIARLRRSVESSKRAFAFVAKGSAEGYWADDETRARAAHLSMILDSAATQIRAIEESGPLKNVAPAPPSESALQAVAGHPLYARAHALIRRLLDPGLRLTEEECTPDSLRGGLRPTYELFELLVLFRIEKALLTIIGPEWTIKRQDFVLGALLSHDGTSTNRWTAIAPNGQTRIELAYQPVFAAHKKDHQAAGERSLTGQRRPDFTIAVWRGKQLLAWVILDAKYRASRSAIHDALADVHVYRDSLRWNGLQCAGAFIVAPALAADARRYGEADYLVTHAFGALVLDKIGAKGPPLWLLPALTPISGALRRAQGPSGEMAAC